jgi:hypothetical protein
VPLFWDPAYQAAARRFLAALEGHLATRPGVLFVDVTPGAETNPYRMGTLDDDPRSDHVHRRARERQLALRRRALGPGPRRLPGRGGDVPERDPRVVTLSQGRLLGAPSRLGTIGDRAVGLGMGQAERPARRLLRHQAASARW